METTEFRYVRVAEKGGIILRHPMTSREVTASDETLQDQAAQVPVRLTNPHEIIDGFTTRIYELELDVYRNRGLDLFRTF